MKYTLVLLLIFVINAYADDQSLDEQLSKCEDRACLRAVYDRNAESEAEAAFPEIQEYKRKINQEFHEKLDRDAARWSHEEDQIFQYYGLTQGR